MSAIERSRSGLWGLDEILEGGFPRGARVLLAGGTGTGKTICCAQYIYSGATRFGEPGVYVCTEEPPQELRSNMMRFGWDLKKLEESKKIAIVDAVYSRLEPEGAEEKSLQGMLFNLRSKLSEVKVLVEQLGAKRLVVDSLPGFGFRVTDTHTLREIFLEVGLLLKDVGCTTVMTTEIVEGSGLISRYGIEEFLATGVVVLSIDRHDGDTLRKLFIRKMRGTSHSLRDYRFSIGRNGVTVYELGHDGRSSQTVRKARRPRVRFGGHRRSRRRSGRRPNRIHAR